MWTDEDRRESLAWLADSKDRCPGCGGRLSETTSADAEDAYLVHLSRCHRCRATADKVKTFDGDKAGLLTRAQFIADAHLDGQEHP